MNYKKIYKVHQHGKHVGENATLDSVLGIHLPVDWVRSQNIKKGEQLIVEIEEDVMHVRKISSDAPPG